MQQAGQSAWAPMAIQAIVDNSVASAALLDQSELSSEAALVLCCATMAATPARTALASELAARIGNWDGVIEIAKSHAMFPLVHRYMSLECSSVMPAEAMSKMRMHSQLIALYNRHLTTELVRLAGLLKAAGIGAGAF